MALNMKTFFTRTATAAVFVFVLLFSLNYNFYTYAGFFAVMGLLGLFEFFNLSKKLGAQPNRFLGLLLYAGSMALAYLAATFSPFIHPFSLLLLYALLL